MEALSYHAFGEALILTAVTPERVIDAVKRLAGDSVSLGPIRAGPAGAAVVNARGSIGEPVAEELTAELLTYSVRLPVELALDVRVGATGHFEASGDIDLRLVVRTVRPLAIVIDVDPVAPGDVNFTIRARGVQSRLLRGPATWRVNCVCTRRAMSTNRSPAPRRPATPGSTSCR